MELRLRQSGIRVFSESEWAAEPARAFLYVKVETVAQGSVLFAVHVKVDLEQGVLLDRNQAVRVVGTTWQSRGSLGILGRAALSTAVPDSVRDGVDEFINAYLAVNPK